MGLWFWLKCKPQKFWVLQERKLPYEPEDCLNTAIFTVLLPSARKNKHKILSEMQWNHRSNKVNSFCLEFFLMEFLWSLVNKVNPNFRTVIKCLKANKKKTNIIKFEDSFSQMCAKSSSADFLFFIATE